MSLQGEGDLRLTFGETGCAGRCYRCVGGGDLHERNKKHCHVSNNFEIL